MFRRSPRISKNNEDQIVSQESKQDKETKRNAKNNKMTVEKEATRKRKNKSENEVTQRKVKHKKTVEEKPEEKIAEEKYESQSEEEAQAELDEDDKESEEEEKRAKKSKLKKVIKAKGKVKNKKVIEDDSEETESESDEEEKEQSDEDDQESSLEEEEEKDELQKRANQIKSSKLMMSAFNKETLKFKFGKSEECGIKPRDFSFIFKMRRLIESEELQQQLKPKKGLDYSVFLNKKFRPEKPVDCADPITKAEVVHKLKISAEDESDPEHFVKIFAMCLCTIFLFPNTGTTSFPKKLLPHILLMDKVSWPDHVVEHLNSNLANKKEKQVTVVGCTTLLVCRFCEHTKNYISKRDSFENATPRFLRWDQYTLCKKLVTDFGKKNLKDEDRYDLVQA
ncbi:VID27-like protein [Papaver somniferum]|uniref:VID27-like protein n=1 Tax=Papaver somniferum TaxID=3469 RepID=UPI000E6FDD7B|nr:VID27-like protein [Papaver somniferum]